jgi:hypothetical protein
MATLTIDSLLNCNFIPDFIGSGNRMIFNNTAAPTSWTKDTSSHNNKALRVTTGTVAPGGSLTFTQVFPATNKPVQGTISTSNAGVAVNQVAVASLSSGQINVITQSPISIQNATLTTAQIASHSHTAQRFPEQDTIGCQATEPGPAITGRILIGRTSGGTVPAPGSHGHSVPGGTQHSHVVTSTQHSHPITNAGSHSHPITTTAQDFNILYVDVIIAVKN